MGEQLRASEWVEELDAVEVRLSAQTTRRKRARRFLFAQIAFVGAFLYGSIHFHRFPLGLFSSLVVGGILYSGARAEFRALEHERETLLARLGQLRAGDEK